MKVSLFYGLLIFLAMNCLFLVLSCGDDDSGDDSGSGPGQAQEDDDDPSASSGQAIDDDSSIDDDDDDDDSAPPWKEPGQPLRRRTSLNGTWSFTPEGYPERDVPVPCFWEAVPSWPDWEQYACPDYLAGTPDENLEITEGSGFELRTIHRGIYELAIELDDPLPVTRIHFESIHHRAEVFFNDAQIGTHEGPYWPVAFDVSSAVVPGENRLRVELEDGQALLDEQGITLYPVGYYGLTDITGLYRSVVMEELPGIYADDVFIAPSTRRGDLTVKYSLVNSTDADVTVWVISRAVSGTGNVELETTARQVTIPAGESAERVVAEPWDDAEFWTPVNPALYTLRTLILDETGESVDLREDRFGFREIWIEGGHFMLNGERVNLFGDNLDDQAARPRYWGPQYLSCETAPETFRRLKEDLNINLVRFHQAPPERCLHDLADKMGLMVISESPIYARTDIVTPFYRGEEYMENSRRWLSDWVRSERNHPSIVLWSLENEMFMYGFGLSLEQVYSLKEPARQQDVIERDDGVFTTGRPVSWDGDGSFLWWFFPEKPETVNWHYPFARYFTVYPGREWFTDAIAHYEPYLIDEAPTGVGETMVVRREEKPGRTLDMAKALQGSAVRAMRILGFSDIRPYKLNWAWHDYYPDGNEHPWAQYYHSLYTPEQKERLVRHLRESYHPVAVFDFEYTRVGPNEDGSFGPVALAADTEIERTLVALNDSFLPGEDQTVTWSAFDETAGEEIAGDSFMLSVPVGESVEREIRFTTPDAAETHDLTLYITSEMEGLPNGAYTTEYRFAVEP